MLVIGSCGELEKMIIHFSKGSNESDQMSVNIELHNMLGKENYLAIRNCLPFTIAFTDRTVKYKKTASRLTVHIATEKLLVVPRKTWCSRHGPRTK